MLFSENGLGQGQNLALTYLFQVRSTAGYPKQIGPIWANIRYHVLQKPPMSVPMGLPIAWAVDYPILGYSRDPCDTRRVA